MLPNGPPSRCSSTVNDTNFRLSLAGVAACMYVEAGDTKELSLEVSISVRELYLLHFREFLTEFEPPP